MLRNFALCYNSAVNSDRQRYAIHAAVFAALGNPTRHEMLHLLCECGHTPSELAELLGVSRPNVSQHLAVLQREGLVIRSREEGKVIWRVVDTRLAQGCELIDEVVGRQAAARAQVLERQAEPAADGERERRVGRAADGEREWPTEPAAHGER
jgi:ArsR family transcriptional regulator